MTRSSTFHIDRRLRANIPYRSRRVRFLTAISSILSKRREKKIRAAEEEEGERQGRNLGINSWDGFAWAEQRQGDGLRVKRVWDEVAREWIVVLNMGRERSISPCAGPIKWANDDHKYVGDVEEQVKQDSCFAGLRASDSSNEVGSTRRSDSDQADESGETVCQRLVTTDSGSQMSVDTLISTAPGSQ